MANYWWAKLRRIQVGPYPSREEAILALKARFASYTEREWSWSKNAIMSGYGNYGPSFDIRWTIGNDVK